MAKKTKIITPHEGFQDKFVRTNVDVCFAGGVLNPQPVDSLVATPDGFVRIGDLKTGDVICDTKGGTQTVNFVLNKGIQPCVEFTLSDGRKVQSALSHNWLVKNSRGVFKQLTASDIIDYIDKQEAKRKKHIDRLRIPLTKEVYFNAEDNLPIHPYVLGYLIGNGCVSEKAHTMYISTSDPEVVDYISSLGYTLNKTYTENSASHYEFRGVGFRQLVKDSGIYGLISGTKRIPEKYLYSSVENRFLLLKGLFDSDGTAGTIGQSGKYSCVRYVTISEGLKNDIISLVQSLGGTANYTTKPAYKGIIKGKEYNCKKAYYISARLWNDKEFFYLPRKKNVAFDNRLRRNAVMLGIKSYRLIGNRECVCINVSDDDHLYLTDSYVVTCNCGKTTGAVLMCAQPSLDPNFRGVFLRNNLGDIRSGGGILDEFKSMYRGGVNVVESGEPRVEFPSGARIDVTHIADQSREKVRQRFKGRQYDLIYFDEMTGFSFECFCEVCTRNRGTGKWTGKIRGTTNPERNHWLREFLDWYIGIDGFIREDRNGVVRYFYMSGETVRDVVWGDSKEEVYQKCKIQIDRQLARINGKTGNATYKDLIRSFTFYLGKMTENVSSIGNNSGYVGAVAMSGGRNAEQLLEGNWNVSPNEALDAPIPQDMANQVFMNDDKRNGDRWVTCDLADTGTDNFLAIAWDGFHIIDMLILGRTTPRQNAERLQIFAAEHDVADNHIIYDAIRGTYINDYIPDAVPYVSYRAPMGMYGRLAQKLKDECYLRLVETIKRGDLSIEEHVALRTYEHQNLKERITIQNEFMEECAVVRFKDVASGKKALLTKKEMNQKLGKGRSMDLLDPIAMRMYPVLEFAYGEELEKTTNLNDAHDDDYDDWGRRRGGSIYDDSFWC